MRILWLVCGSLMLLSSAAFAQEAKDFGAGVVLGDTLGATGKLWLDHYSAIDIGMGASSDDQNFNIYGDYLYHGWKALPQPPEGKLAAYIGGGPRIQAHSNDTEFGLRAVLGASYFFPSAPLEVFGEMGPFFRMTPEGGVYPIGGVGIRYYFKSWN